MSKFTPIIPQDTTYVEGMKTIMADRSDRYKVNYFKDIEYVKRGDTSLKLQLLIPGNVRSLESPLEKRPVVVYVKGSAWMKQECYKELPNISYLARQGYMVAAVEYRASAEAKFPAFLQDVKSAIRFLRANADKYGVDEDRIAIWGDSSGGHASLMAGFTGDFEEYKTDDNKEYSDKVCAIVDFYGPSDLTKIDDCPRNPEFVYSKEPTPEDILFGGNVKLTPEISAPGNPINYISEDKEIPPVFIAHGDMDSMVPFNQSVLVYEKLRECKKVVEFYKVIGAEHGTFMWTKEMLSLVSDFLSAYM